MDIKGTGTKDYNWLKVVWYDGSWLGESLFYLLNLFIHFSQFLRTLS
jgi:hypothetical protein